MAAQCGRMGMFRRANIAGENRHPGTHDGQACLGGNKFKGEATAEDASLRNPSGEEAMAGNASLRNLSGEEMKTGDGRRQGGTQEHRRK